MDDLDIIDNKVNSIEDEKAEIYKKIAYLEGQIRALEDIIEEKNSAISDVICGPAPDGELRISDFRGKSCENFEHRNLEGEFNEGIEFDVDDISPSKYSPRQQAIVDRIQASINELDPQGASINEALNSFEAKDLDSDGAIARFIASKNPYQDTTGWTEEMKASLYTQKEFASLIRRLDRNKKLWSYHDQLNKVIATSGMDLQAKLDEFKTDKKRQTDLERAILERDARYQPSITDPKLLDPVYRFNKMTGLNISESFKSEEAFDAEYGYNKITVGGEVE